MTNEEKNRLMDDKWPEEYPHGKKALLKAIKEASKAGIFDIENKDEYFVVKKCTSKMPTY